MPQLLHDFVGSLAGALVRGEAIGIRATLDFIRDVGFVGGKSDTDWGEVRIISFAYAAADAAGNPCRRRVAVPLLSVVPIPIQQIDEAEYECALDVRKLDKKGMMVDVAPSEHAASPTAAIKLKLRFKQSDIPAGVSTTLRRVDAASHGVDV